VQGGEEPEDGMCVEDGEGVIHLVEDHHGDPRHVVREDAPLVWLLMCKSVLHVRRVTQCDL
jgi:hypothetical protein